MAVITAFGVLNHTQHAGLTAYFRATSCTDVVIADVLPLLSKVTVYESEYVIGEMKIWDTGSESIEPNNCAMCKVMVYNDGWIVAWFDKESQSQGSGSACSYVDAQTLGGFGTICEYPDKWNGCLLKVTGSSPTDSECPDGSLFCIRNTDSNLGQIQVHAIYEEDYNILGAHFNSGHYYSVEIYQDNGNLVWWGHHSDTHSPLPSSMSNRLYRAIYEMWGSLGQSSNAPDNGYIAIDAAYLDNGGVFSNYTSHFNNSTTGDVYLLPSSEQVNDAFYYGQSARQFGSLNVNVYSGVGSAITWEYWNGISWAALSTTDNTNGFTVIGTNTITFTPPVDWVKTIVNSSDMFWIRSRCTAASYSTTPRLTQGWVYGVGLLDYEDTNLGMYSFEDTAALYCLICGINEYTSGSDEDDVYFYNTSLPGKTIYKHSMSLGAYLGDITGDLEFYMNDKSFLFLQYGFMRRTNGYIIFNIKTIAGTAAIQNVFRCYGHTGGTYDRSYGNMAAVLITG